MTGDLNLGNNAITNLALPTNNSDGANKQWVAYNVEDIIDSLGWINMNGN